MKGNENGGLQQIIDKALADMGHDRASGGFDPGAVNLAEFQRLTGLSRSRAGTLRKKGFSCVHGRTGSRAETTVLTGFEDELDGLIRSGATNSSACFDRIRAKGYPGGPARVKEYIAARSHLAPPARRAAPSRGTGMRFATEPGEAYQMDWGFVDALDPAGNERRMACFAMAGLDYSFTNPYSGNEKGSVENKVGALRRNLFVPVPSFHDVEAFNRRLLERCAAASEGKPHYRKGAACC